MKEYKVNLNGKEYIVYQDVDGKFIKPNELKVTGGTAMKPAVEPIVVARKPLSEKTVANNVLKWGTGGLNIDASRIGTSGGTAKANPEPESKTQNAYGNGLNGGEVTSLNAGRFPANIILGHTEDCVETVSTPIYECVNGCPVKELDSMADASRFFYVAKASKKDRNEGLEGLEEVEVSRYDGGTKWKVTKTNFHPTVKPTTLMEYLIKLVTPEGGTVLDPFTGSGSTGKAALLNGYKFIGCELTEEYLPIIEGRLKFAENKYAEQQAKIEAEQAETLFDIEENE